MKIFVARQLEVDRCDDSNVGSCQFENKKGLVHITDPQTIKTKTNMRYTYAVANGVYSPAREWEKPVNYQKEKENIYWIFIIFILGFIALNAIK